MNYVLKLTSQCFLLNKNIKLKKNKKEWDMENSTYTFREMNHVFQLLVLELRIKSKTVMSWS